MRGKNFISLEEENEYLRWWDDKIASQRIHGSTKRQVWEMFISEERPALQPLPAEAFSMFKCGTRIVHPDGTIQVEQNYYAVPEALLHKSVEVRWTGKLVHISFDGKPVHTHIQSSSRGKYVPGSVRPLGQTQLERLKYLERKGVAIGPEVGAWVAWMFHWRGLQACKTVQGVMGLKEKHSPAALTAACATAVEYHISWHAKIRQLCEEYGKPAAPPAYSNEHEFLRSSTAYQQELFPEENEDVNEPNPAVAAITVAGDTGDAGSAQSGSGQ